MGVATSKYMIDTCRIIFGQLNDSVCKTSLSLTVHLGLEATLINYTNDIVMAMFELHILLIVL